MNICVYIHLTTAFCVLLNSHSLTTIPQHNCLGLWKGRIRAESFETSWNIFAASGWPQITSDLSVTTRFSPVLPPCRCPAAFGKWFPISMLNVSAMTGRTDRSPSAADLGFISIICVFVSQQSSGVVSSFFGGHPPFRKSSIFLLQAVTKASSEIGAVSLSVRAQGSFSTAYR